MLCNSISVYRAFSHPTTVYCPPTKIAKFLSFG